MTSLTDKMEGLKKSLYTRDMPPTAEKEAFNQAIDQCKALAKAEAMVVGDWEAEFDTKFNNPDSLNSSTPINPVYLNGRIGYLLEDVKTFITTLLAAKDRDIVEAYAQGWNEGQIDLSARLKI